LERWPLLQEPYVVLCPRDFVPAGTARDLASLAKTAPLVRFSARSKTGAEIDAHLRRLRLDVPRRLEFDTPHAVTAAVAAGLGWAITTILCVIEADIPVDGLAIAALPGPALQRRLTLVARRAELGALPQEIAMLTRERLSASSRPFIAQHCPWIDDRFAVG
jgi:DNA-binding transcriptional LysR family regulator